jgi:hypothetical protein
MLHRPGGEARDRNSSASQAGRAGARGSRPLNSDGALAIRQRMRAPLRFACRRGAPASTARRCAPPPCEPPSGGEVERTRVAPQLPITAESAAHLTPSSIAHSASWASRASTWTRLCDGRPGGGFGPTSRSPSAPGPTAAAFRCRVGEQEPGPAAVARWTANSSDRVGPGGEGRVHRSPKPLGMARFSGGATAPPRTRDKPVATRLTTFLF